MMNQKAAKSAKLNTECDCQAALMESLLLGLSSLDNRTLRR
jgi:hypothetical protein